jgi:alkanesulfonate monooxygenase SsuD/methylene tetrahydromethanopterin reductase-like flavin-dependent oxidoreductase (luciferase family)
MSIVVSAAGTSAPNARAVRRADALAPLRFDASVGLANVSGRRTWRELLAEARERVVHMERLGFDGAWFGEHHFDVNSTDACPNPVMLAADMAGRTERLRLCMGAVTLTTWHPLRFAEDLAMLDHFSDGRVDVAFSRGILPFEINNLNPDADRRDMAKSRAIFAENLEIVRRAWSQDRFSWQGERYRFPQPAMKYWPHPDAPPAEGFSDKQGNWVSMTVVPRPLQQPTPRMWATSENEEGFRSAAEAELGGITLLPSGNSLKRLLNVHRETSARASGVLRPLGHGCALARHTLVARTDAKARAVYEPIVNRMFNLFNIVRGRQVWLDEGENEADIDWDAVNPFDMLMERGHIFVGSPETVTRLAWTFVKSHGIRHWLFGGSSDDSIPSASRTMSLELLAREVFPALRSMAG